MDELEISGKRYISSRRAGKEHKYHPDYIGQLVRAGKVEGQKVGRAWYVDADSLARYLSQDLGPRGPVLAYAAPSQKEEQIVVEEKIEEGENLQNIEIVKIEEVVEEEKIPIRTDGQVQRRTGGLTYMADDAPLFPAIKKNAVPMSSIPMRMDHEPGSYIGVEKPLIAPVVFTPKKVRSAGRMAKLGLIALIGVVSLSLTLGVGYSLGAIQTLEGAKLTASLSFVKL